MARYSRDRGESVIRLGGYISAELVGHERKNAKIFRPVHGCHERHFQEGSPREQRGDQYQASQCLSYLGYDSCVHQNAPYLCWEGYGQQGYRLGFHEEQQAT